jgi:hypothetical protein
MAPGLDLQDECVDERILHASPAKSKSSAVMPAMALLGGEQRPARHATASFSVYWQRASPGSDYRRPATAALLESPRRIASNKTRLCQRSVRESIQLGRRCRLLLAISSIVFRSRINEHADGQILGELDATAHAEAVAGGGLLKCWYGNPDQNGRNLATCTFSPCTLIPPSLNRLTRHDRYLARPRRCDTRRRRIRSCLGHASGADDVPRVECRASTADCRYRRWDVELQRVDGRVATERLGGLLDTASGERSMPAFSAYNIDAGLVDTRQPSGLRTCEDEVDDRADSLHYLRHQRGRRAGLAANAIRKRQIWRNEYTRKYIAPKPQCCPRAYLPWVTCLLCMFVTSNPRACSDAWTSARSRLALSLGLTSMDKH